MQGPSTFYFLMYMDIIYSIGGEHLEVVTSWGIVVRLLFYAVIAIILMVTTTMLLLKVNSV